MDVERMRQWISAHREDALDVLRIYLGFALFARGVSFIGQMQALTEQVKATQLDFAAGMLAHYVVTAHIAGGLLLAVGLVTRLAAAVQIPVLAGAAVFIHAKQGLFTPQMTLELTLLVLVLLCVYAAIGAKRWSVDAYLARTAPVGKSERIIARGSGVHDVQPPLGGDPRDRHDDLHT